MRRIVCFGDSNTYGCSPIDGSRYGEDIRWTGVLNSLLGEKFEVVNEGKNARTIAFDDPYTEGCNGMNDIVDCLDHNDPIDLFIIMLGTNDLKVYFEATPQMIAANLLKMCEVVREKTDAKLLLVSPMLLGDQIEFSPLRLEFGREQVDYSFELAPEIEKVAEKVGADFIDLAVVAMSSDVDCLHLMPEEHAKVAQAMRDKVLLMFKEELEQEAKEEEEERRRQEEEERKRAEEEAAKQEEERRRAEEEAAKKEEEERLEAEKRQAESHAKESESLQNQEDALLHVQQLEASGFQTASAEQIEQWQSEDSDQQSDALLGQIKEIERQAKAILDEDGDTLQSDGLLGAVGEIEHQADSILDGGAESPQPAAPGDDAVEKEQSEEKESKDDGIQFQELVGKVFGGQKPKAESSDSPLGESSLASGTDSVLNQPVFTLGNEAALNDGAPGAGLAPEVSAADLSEADDEIKNVTVIVPDSVEKERMISGKLYRCDSELRAEMARAKKLLDSYNRTTSAEVNERNSILMSLFWYAGQDAQVEPPFRCEYGSNISVGDRFNAEFDCIMLDSARIKIGNDVFFGPKVNIFTAGYPIYAPVRNERLKYSKEVTIGDDVWIGGNVTINPGVHIGNNVVIETGSVVTEDIPDGVVAAGNPCRIIRKISDADKEEWESKKAERDE